RALVTLESGQRVVSSTWVQTTGETTTYEWTADDTMTPNVYAHVMLLQPYVDEGNDLPMRLYGVTPVMVHDPATKLTPVIRAPKEMVPSSQQTVEIKEKNGQPMTYSLAVVDEGLLGLTRHSTPNPWGHFHRREGLGVKTWDVFNQVVGGFAGSLETLLAIGGGDGEEEDDNGKAQRFPPVVIVKGPFSLQANATSKHTLDIPTYLGEVRIMVVAGNRSAYGAAEQSVFVRKPLMAYATLPRVLAPKDVLQMPVTVFSTIEGRHTVDIRVEATGDIKLESTQKKLSFDGAGESAISFPVEVGPQPGLARLKFTVQSGPAKHTEAIELDVRYPNPPEITVATHTLKAGAEWSPQLLRDGLHDVSAEVQVYRGLAIGLGRQLTNLINYPHGCLEQTTSKAFPQVFLNRLIDLSAEESSRVQDHISAAIEKLRTYQGVSGGFGAWPGLRAHPWITNWVGHFLLEARRSGFVVDDTIIDRWRSHQEHEAREWTEFNSERAHLVQAYRLYTLALAGKPDLSSMNRLREQPNLDNLAAVRLAVAYALAGAPEAAEALIPAAFSYAEINTSADPTFGSALRDQAMALEALALLNKWDRAQPIAEKLASALDGDRHLSTQEASFALLALSRFASRTIEGAVPVIKIITNGTPRSVSLTKAIYTQAFDVPEKKATDSKSRFAIKNEGESPVQIRLIRRGYPNIGATEPRSQGLKLDVEYSLQTDQFVQGEDITAKVTVTNTSGRRLADLALTQIVPSGWEIRNDRFEGRYDAGGKYEYRDIRDDRVYTYFSLDSKASKSFEIRLHSAFIGKFYLPPVQVESMYDPSVHAQTQSRWIEVERAGAAP
ncbi:MAG: alpha-2-macroglobulin family protein, partial [Myxococcota bacterium]